MEVWTLGKGFYIKLARNNIRRNQKKFIPYFIAATIMISVYFLVVMIIYSPGLEDVPETTSLRVMFQIGFYTLNIFVAIFMLYINSFLIKQRRKEFGLYGILGLEKRHIGRVMLWENLFINGSAIILGIGTACVFGWLIFMLLLKSIKVSLNTYFAIPIEAFVITLIFFSILYFIILILNLLQVRMANPIDLLKSDHMGEKKARFLIPITIIGLAVLGYAYYIALKVANPLQALNQFFLAVVMVIIASYALFTSGSITLLKILKKNKKYYYQPDNFVSVAGMFHRMKQNASGLASICILSTMVLVTISTCIALFIGQEDALIVQNKDDITMEVSGDSTEKQLQLFEEMITKASNENGVVVDDKYRYYSVDGMFIYQNQQFIIPEKDINYFERTVQNAVGISFLTLSDYNRICGVQENLDNNQMILLSDDEYNDVKEFTAGGQTYQITKYSSDTIFTNGKHRKAEQEIYIVMKDMNTLEQLTQKMSTSAIYGKSTKIIVNISGSQEDCVQFLNQIKGEYSDITQSLGIEDIFTDRYMGYSIFGGLLFMGAFFTVLFLCATVLIIYFKQISEGYEDKERFEMLQKVGMDDLEVKRTINKQILIVFFLPLFGALLHVAMASNMIIKLLEVFWLYNVKLTILCITGSCAVFTFVYIIVYRLTARTYCRIVKW
jgi:putative ABC transport system permease protein